MSNYTPKTQKYIESKNKLLNNAKNFSEMREKIIEGFRAPIFLLNYDDDDEFEEARQKQKEEKTSETKIVWLIMISLWN